MPSSNEGWEGIRTKAQTALLNSMPSEWLIPQDKLPPPEQADVMDVPATCGLLSEKELLITESLATEIVQRIARAEWTSEDVTRAFCKRACVAHQLTNCLTATMFEPALKRARELDAHFARTGKVTGPLHGLPVSLKDNFNVRGYASSIGFCSLALEAMGEESTIVAILRELGAVPYVKTNVPTAMMVAETVNYCWGRTTNPLNRLLTSGGSSGGESALLTLRGSPLGIGTDIGGSLRIPAACTGLFTLRPSFGRFPNFDARSGLPGQEAVPSVHGPMARSVGDLNLYARSVVGTKPWEKDPKCIPLEWREKEVERDLEGRKLKIAVMWTNGLVTPTPPVTRALKTVVEKLKEKGHEIVTWEACGYDEAAVLLPAFFTADGGKSIEDVLKPTHEPLLPELARYGEATDRGVHNLWQLHKRRTALQKKMLDRWASVPHLDAILSPTTPYAGAPKHGDFKNVLYTGLFNLLDYSSGSFPTGVFVDREVDVYSEDFRPVGEQDERCRRSYDGEVAHGMPVSLQLTGRRLEDEKVLGMMEMIVGDLGH